MKLLLDSGLPLILSDRARAFALELAQQFGWKGATAGPLVFTSGQRDFYGQASAMAANVAASGDRQWISKEYLYRPIADALTAWLVANPTVIARGAMANGLAGVLRTFPPAELGKLSRHLSGDAFDVLPLPDAKDPGVKAWLTARAAEGRVKFLTKEQKLDRWHVDVLR